MNINRTTDGSTLILAIEGRLEATTAPELEKIVKKELGGVSELILDLEKLDYISSAGLRVLLKAKKKMKKGTIKVINVNDLVREVFEVTNLTKILTIE